MTHKDSAHAGWESDSDKATAVDADEDVQWQEKLIRNKLKQYEGAKDQAEMNRLRAELLILMRDLAANHPDSEERARWAMRAERFEKASDEEKENILLDIGKGLGLIIVSPFLLAGGVLYGAGLLVKGIGNAFTLGRLGRYMK